MLATRANTGEPPLIELLLLIRCGAGEWMSFDEPLLNFVAHRIFLKGVLEGNDLPFAIRAFCDEGWSRLYGDFRSALKKIKRALRKDHRDVRAQRTDLMHFELVMGSFVDGVEDDSMTFVDIFAPGVVRTENMYEIGIFSEYRGKSLAIEAIPAVFQMSRKRTKFVFHGSPIELVFIKYWI
jgi:hypothetical protein